MTRIAPTASPSELASRHVELVAARWGPDIEITIALAATLLLRLDAFAPVLHLVVPNTRHRRLPRLRDGSLVSALEEEHSGFSSVARFTTGSSSDPCARIVVGGDGRGVTVGASGWRCGVGDLPGEPPGNALAAAYAGVLAAAEVFQAMLEPFAGAVRRYRGRISLWDLAVDGRNGPALPEPLDLGQIAFAACGGVATGTFWTLALLRLTGRPLLVDPDVIDDERTNLNRHLTASHADIGQPKANLAAAMLADAGAAPTPLPERWNTPEAAIKTVVVTPDDDSVRRQVQLDLPRTVLNGGTSDDGIYAVSRHNFLTNACLACTARSDLVDRSPVAAAARRMGLREDQLMPHIDNPEPLPPEVIAKATALTHDERRRLAGVGGRQVLEHVCGTIRPMAAGPAVSAPMLSAAPGVLLASELARLALGQEAPGSVTMTSILTGPHSRWTFLRQKTADCACSDELYRRHYRSKWGS